MSDCRFVLAPPHADWGYEWPEKVLTCSMADPSSGMSPAVLHVGSFRYTAAWKTLPSYVFFVSGSGEDERQARSRKVLEPFPTPFGSRRRQ